MATSVYCLPIAKNSRENFCGTLKNCENHESLAQRIFPRLRYSMICKHVYNGYTNEYTHTCMYTCMHTPMHMRARAHTYARTHGRTHTRMHTHSHKCICISIPMLQYEMYPTRSFTKTKIKSFTNCGFFLKNQLACIHAL